MSVFGKAVREFRKQHVGTLKEMADRMGMSVVRLSELERGIGPLTIEHESRFARVVVGVYAGIYDARPITSLEMESER